MAKNREQMIREEREKFRAEAQPDQRVAAALELIADTLERVDERLAGIGHVMSDYVRGQNRGR